MRTKLKAVDCFRKKVPSQIIDRVLNMPRILNMLGLHHGVVIVYELCYSNYDNSLVTQNWMTRTIVNLWQGSKYASGPGYVRVLNILRYIIYATASDIFNALEYLEHLLFWHIKVYLGIFRHCSDIFRHICNSVQPWRIQNSGIFRAFFAKRFKCIRLYIPLFNVWATRY